MPIKRYNPIYDDVGPVSYSPVPTAKKFHACESHYRGIMGPIGSGKSCACVMEIYTRSLEQTPYNGVRSTRWAIIRNTYPTLISTSMKTWKEWIPESICPISLATPITGRMQAPLADGTKIDMEIIFLALDRDEDVNKLKSLELTGAWINEASEISQAVVKMAGGRVDRYPSKRRGGCKWSGVIMDTNPPDEESWWYHLCEVVKPTTYTFFKQPPAIMPLPRNSKDDPVVYVANTGQGPYPPPDNVENHNSGYEYWLRQVAGSDPEWIKVFLMGEYGSIMTGKPVYPEWIDSMHVSAEELTPYRGLPLVFGWDFGVGNAAVAIGQLSPRGQLRIIDEICAEDMGIRQFTRDIVKPHIVNHYSGMEIQHVCDPAGSQRSQTDEVTCIEELQKAGLYVEMAPSNKFIARREAVAGFLLKLMDGQPGFLLSPKCKVLRKGFNGGYRYGKRRVQTGEQYTAEPEKNKWSHCIAEGTLIETESGRLPIEDIQEGSFVMTPGGPRKVLFSGLTRKNSEVFELTTSSGQVLFATGDHRIFANNGWKRLDALQYGDILHCISKGDPSCPEKQSIPSKNSMASSITGNQVVTTRPATGRSRRPDICTEMSGSILTDLFLKDLRSITKTGIRRTTLLRILSALKAPRIREITASAIIDCIQRGCPRGLRRLEKLQRNGTDLLLVESGTANTARILGRTERRGSEHVLTAGKSTSVIRQPGNVDSAHHLARRLLESEAESMMSVRLARSVDRRSLPISIPGREPAVSVALIRRSQRRRDVYDLTVQTDHCFFASGILVHNCADALQYLSMKADGGFCSSQERTSTSPANVRTVETESAEAWT